MMSTLTFGNYVADVRSRRQHHHQHHQHHKQQQQPARQAGSRYDHNSVRPVSSYGGFVSISSKVGRVDATGTALLYDDRTHTQTRTFNGPLSGTTRVSQYRKGKTSQDFTDSERQWHQLGHMQVCISPQTDNHASTHHSVFLQAGCPSCHPTNSVKVLKAAY